MSDKPITVEVAPFRSAIRVLVHATQRRNSIPILNNVRITVTDGVMKLEATDLDRHLIYTLAVVTGELETTVNLRRLCAVLNSIDGDRVTLSAGAGVLKVEANFAEFVLSTLSPADFPAMKQTGGDVLSFNSAALASSLAFALPAVSTEAIRYYLNGVHIHGDADGFKFAATNGHQLRVETLPSRGPFAGRIIPADAVKLLQRIIAATPGEPTIATTFSRTHFTAVLGNWELRAKLIDGTYPDYARAVPAETAAAFTVGTRELKTAMKAATAVLSSGTVAIGFESRNGALGASCEGLGDERSESVARGSDAGALGCKVGFNYKYVKQIADAFTPGRLALQVSSPSSPTRWTCPEAANRLVVLMPMRI